VADVENLDGPGAVDDSVPDSVLPAPRRAAQELGESIDATPHTRHQVTTALKFGLTEHQFDFRPGDVLVIDEAAMSGIHTLHEVVRYALRRGADVRLVGDDKQLGAVEAGGAIRLIAHDVGAVRFRKVVRFTDPDQAAASLHIREGNPVGLGYYLDHNWVAGGSRETMRDAAQRAWRADLDAGRQTLLIVPTLPVTHQRRHESQMGPYAGIPRRFRPWTTCELLVGDADHGFGVESGVRLVSKTNHVRLAAGRGVPDDRVGLHGQDLVDERVTVGRSRAARRPHELRGNLLGQ
jgi:hypothetical protein